VYFALDLPAAMLGDGVDNRLWHQRASWARLHAFAAGDAGRKAHRIIKVEHGFRVDSPKRHADDVIDLHFAASPHAKPAIDAGVEIDCHGRVREVRLGNAVRGESRGFNALDLGPVPKLGDAIRRLLARRLVGEQKLHDHAASLDCSLGPCLHHHVRGGLANARSGEHPLAFDLDHAGAAVAIGPIARLRQPAKMWDVDSFALRHLPDGLAGPSRHHLAIQREEQLISHGVISCPSRAFAR
jgi:hypothetical protein